jgi:hypothetical protein
MRIVISIMFVTLLSLSYTNAQTPEQTYRELERVRSENSNEQEFARIENLLVSPDEEDIVRSKKENVNVVRILSPEYLQKNTTFPFSSIRNSGVYYSFYFRRHDYGHGSDIRFSKGILSVGFAGADYGFIRDLGKVSLQTITPNYDNFLRSHAPPTNEPDIRKVQTKSRNFEIDGQTYSSSVSAVVGNTFLLRSINFRASDVLIAFTILRQDSDDSLIIFWKLLEQFETPKILTGSKTDQELLERLKRQLTHEKYKSVQFEVNNMVVTLRGTASKSEIPNLVYWANDFGAKKVINLLEVH